MSQQVKKRRTFRFSDDTVRMLDEVAKYESERLREVGIIGYEYDRTSLLEVLISKAYELCKEGRSIQDV